METQKFPKMVKVKQNFGPHTSIGNVYASVKGEIEGILPSTDTLLWFPLLCQGLCLL